MANLNLSPNLFLEVNELKRFRDGIEKDGYKVFVKYLTKSFGIAQDSNNTFLYSSSGKPYFSGIHNILRFLIF